VLNGETVVASGTLGETPWPGTGALFWTKIEVRAPSHPGTAALLARFDATPLHEPHRDAIMEFHVAVVAKPEHTLTVEVTAGGAPIEEACVRLGPYRAVTNASGVAQVKMAKGAYDLFVWKAGYDTPAKSVRIETDTTLPIEVWELPEEDPDSVWTA
jgi:hypothetical protein